MGPLLDVLLTFQWMHMLVPAADLLAKYVLGKVACCHNVQVGQALVQGKVQATCDAKIASQQRPPVWGSNPHELHKEVNYFALESKHWQHVGLRHRTLRSCMQAPAFLDVCFVPEASWSGAKPV